MVIAPGLAMGTAAGAAASGSDPVARVPIEFARTQVRVPVSINGSAPFRLILDTGMPTRGVLLRQTERVDALGLDFPDEESLSGGGSGPAVAARVASGARIEVGGYAIADVAVIVLPAEVPLPRDTDGVIGAELFEKFAVRVDVDAERIDLFDSANFQPAGEETSVPLRFREGKAFVDARVTVQGGPPVTADLAIDLGAGHALWLNDGSNGKFAPPPGAIETTLGRGLSGDIRGSIGRVGRIELGNFAFENVVTLFPVKEHQHPGGVDFRDGFVGAKLLTRFVVTFDYPAKRMILQRGARFTAPFEYDMTGMVLDPEGLDRRRVNAVLEGSPAKQAGVEAGDVLVAVDGETLSVLGPDGLERALQREGVEIRVTLQRGSNTIEKQFRLRRLV